MDQEGMEQECLSLQIPPHFPEMKTILSMFIEVSDARSHHRHWFVGRRDGDEVGRRGDSGYRIRKEAL